ncbi:MvdC/MvdD family ATP grasp protein [Spirosoma sp. 48-14]|uniref:MvdC/MvdD family ATP grasp protein n=1 Tax=Spirosoma sp. 48-14 TaxID=1895854 RepID=UPI0009608C40|nr:hypothetical protein [Spirosoma sp. 48-14]OJW70492.1 MAG: hypothetical protein BGO59_24920 [Spirosoma sp. 48-14]
MILIFTDKDDVHAEAVIEHLKAFDADFVRFDQDVESLQKTIVTYKSGDWSIKTDKEAYVLNQISKVWLRKSYVNTTLQQDVDRSNHFKLWKGEWNKTLQGMYSTLSHLPWLTPFREVFRAENKYLQASVAAKCGLKMPPTLISNDKQELIEFASVYGRVAFKLMYQDVYQVADGTFHGLYTNVITADSLSEFEVMGENPIVLQEYVEKQYEVRYTVVGDQHFVAKIDSQMSDVSRIDWRRYDLKSTPYIAIEPPAHIRNGVNTLMIKLGLIYGALDFIVKPNNDWIFLEINPLGQYLWVEDLTGMPISKAIAKWLV